jgi:hypothetical protein
MKSTVKLTTAKSITTTPCNGGGVVVELTDRCGQSVHVLQSLHLSPDQVGAFIFGLEQAAAAAEIRAQRLAVAA